MSALCTSMSPAPSRDVSRKRACSVAIQRGKIKGQPKYITQSKLSFTLNLFEVRVPVLYSLIQIQIQIQIVLLGITAYRTALSS